MVSPEFEAERLRPRRYFLWIVDVAWVDLVYDIDRSIAQHALGADIEQLNDALAVGGDDGESGTR